MEQFEEKRKEALELYHQNKLIIVDHALERMIEGIFNMKTLKPFCFKVQSTIRKSTNMEISVTISEGQIPKRRSLG